MPRGVGGRGVGGPGDEKATQASYLPAEAKQAGLARGKVPVCGPDSDHRTRHLSVSSAPCPHLFFSPSAPPFTPSFSLLVMMVDMLTILTFGFVNLLSMNPPQ